MHTSQSAAAQLWLWHPNCFQVSERALSGAAGTGKKTFILCHLPARERGNTLIQGKTGPNNQDKHPLIIYTVFLLMYAQIPYSHLQVSIEG